MEAWTIMPVDPAADREYVYKFLEESFFGDEPVTSLIGAPLLDEAPCIQGLQQGYSLKAFSRGKLVGVVISLVPGSLDVPPITEGMKVLHQLFSRVEEESCSSIWGAGAMDLHLLAVRPSYRRQGLAERLVEQTVAMARREGFSTITVLCTSHYSARLFGKMGWTLRYSKAYDQLKDSSGNPTIVPPKPHTHVNLFSLDISEKRAMDLD